MRRGFGEQATVDEEALVRQHLPLVHHVVTSVRGRLPNHVPVDDLTSAGMAGLLHAARGYDADRGVPFAAYATTRVRGAILDELRGTDWASRSIRSKARSLQQAADTLGGGIREAAAAAGLSEQEARQVVADVHRASVLSVDGLLDGEGSGAALPTDRATPEGALLDREQTGYLRDAVDVLPDRLRHVVVGFFFEERTMADLGEELGVSESRISHMRAEAMSLLREAMAKTLDVGDAPPAEPETGVAARRRAAYCASVAGASDYRSRLEAPAPARTAVPA